MRADTARRWSAVPLAALIALDIPQFAAEQPIRVVHGLLLAAACILLAWTAARPASASRGEEPHGLHRRPVMTAATLINCFEVTPEREQEFLRLWHQADALLRSRGGHLTTRLHKALQPDSRYT